MKKLLVISSYPPKGITHHKDIVGVASYTKNTLTALATETTITVLAEKLPNTENLSIEKNITVKRIWQRNSLMLFPILLKEALLYYKDTKNILIPVEVAMFGGKLQLALLPLFLAILRFFGKNVTVILHQVITQIEELSGHVYTYTGIQATLLNLALVLFYKLILLTASKVVVMDEVLKDRLPKPHTKIVVIPHGVEHFPPVSKLSRSKKFTILYFGFLAYYKGADILADAYSKISANERKNMQLIFAGGANPNHTDKPSYMNYIHSLPKDAITGFVPQEKIATYFAAADLVVFPYRTLMSSSGPLSMAFSFGKPFLLSKALAPILKTKDIQDTLTLPEKSFVFTNEKELTHMLVNIKKDKKTLEKLTAFSKAMRTKRSWKFIGKSYDAVLFGK